MPAIKGGGRWQTAILASLDGQPRVAREVVQEILGRPPGESEYNAAHRAARVAGRQRAADGWLEPGQWPGVRLLVGRRVDRWVSDSIVPHRRPPSLAPCSAPCWKVSSHDTYAENPADPGRCRHCGKPPHLHNLRPACDDDSDPAAAR